MLIDESGCDASESKSVEAKEFDQSQFDLQSTQQESSFELPYCTCQNLGSGKFVECRSESGCRSSRFFHMTCVGFVDSEIPHSKRTFLCQECERSLLNPKRQRRVSEIQTDNSYNHPGKLSRFPLGGKFIGGNPERNSSIFSLLFPQQTKLQKVPRNSIVRSLNQSRGPLYLPPCPKFPLPLFTPSVN
jgi:hypothetical protein